MGDALDDFANHASANLTLRRRVAKNNHAKTNAAAEKSARLVPDFTTAANVNDNKIMDKSTKYRLAAYKYAGADAADHKDYAKAGMLTGEYFNVNHAMFRRLEQTYKGEWETCAEHWTRKADRLEARRNETARAAISCRQNETQCRIEKDKLSKIGTAWMNEFIDATKSLTRIYKSNAAKRCYQVSGTVQQISKNWTGDQPTDSRELRDFNRMRDTLKTSIPLLKEWREYLKTWDGTYDDFLDVWEDRKRVKNATSRDQRSDADRIFGKYQKRDSQIKELRDDIKKALRMAPDIRSLE